MKIHLKKLNERGFDHLVLVVVFVALFAGIGTYMLVKIHAATPEPVLRLGSTNGSCLNLAHGFATVTTCNDSIAQRYTYNSRLKEIDLSGGGCLRPAGASGNNQAVGSSLQVLPASQCGSVPYGGAWTMSSTKGGGYEFKNNHTGGKYCMAETPNGSEDSTYLWTCGQKWYPGTY